MAAASGFAGRGAGGRATAALVALALALPASLALAVTFGPVAIPAGDVWGIVLRHAGLRAIPATWPGYEDIIVWGLRMPEAVEAALVGAALAVAGALFQGLLRNPLADPYLLGVSSGAALGATVAFVVPGALVVAGITTLPLLAFAGALAAVALVYGLARAGSRTPVVTLILAGVAVSALLGAAQTLIITQNHQAALAIGSLYLWLSGGIIATTWAGIAPVAALIALGLAGALALAPRLDAFALGEDGAAHLGIRVERAKLAVVAVAALLVAAAVTLSGLVGFVGLFIPHVCRLLIGPRHRTLVPLAALAGAVFIVWADVLARMLLRPAVVPLGVITALIGGPFFLWLLRRAGRDYRY